MKTNFFTKKLPVWLIVSGAIVLIGLVLFLVFGFNNAVSEKDTKSISVNYDSYLTLGDNMIDTAEDTCLKTIDGYSVKVLQVKKSTFTNGGNLEFVFDGKTDTTKLETVKDAVLSALSAKTEISQAYYTASVNSNQVEVHSAYLGRFAIAMACALVITFVYAVIRFRLGAAITVSALAVHDVLLTLALTAILRVPVSLAFIGVVGFSLAYSLLLSAISFTQIRKMRTDENIKAMSADDAFETVATQARKIVCLVSAITLCAIVVVALLSLIASASALIFAIPAVLAVIVASYSSICLLPAVYAPIKAVFDKRTAARESKYVKAEKKAEVAEKAEEIESENE